MSVHINISDQPISAPELLNDFEARLTSSGGVVSFSGVVRPGGKDSRVLGLFLQSYSPMTENGVEGAVEQAFSRWPLEALAVYHRTGEIRAGETIVFVATASRHRRAAFEAADFLMDYLKTEAVFWKKEITEAGEVWIEPREQDYQDNQRWQQSETN
ncbi:molybdenum cofactor biosynthesis protein MoaE [Ponticaulis sp.]|uniref:molybdenum cofactor biosynthesis protein MoaE n=1 Tax=Ponticaulis sp. TaxID=2020902 RepID=UPI00260415D2|nr:molybdenum cofactor biosynthesis protein MoaE [Ponticaulis sp.]MDF1681603.1 molybdenum cofactor biosynthesis protein MoaE [Ponticaulis sp.]